MSKRRPTQAWIAVEGDFVRFYGSDGLGLPFDVRLHPDEAGALLFKLHSVVLTAKRRSPPRQGRGKAA